VLDTTGIGTGVTGLQIAGEIIEVATPEGPHRHRSTAEGWVVETAAGEVRLAGPIPPPPVWAPILDVDLNRREPPLAVAHWVDEAPALGGSVDDFDFPDPISLEVEDQYRRSEEPYPGPDGFWAQAGICWNEHGLYLAVEVTKDTLDFRPAGAAPLRLDNERDEIHSDGLQVYLRHGEAVYGFLLVPDPSGSAVRVLPVEGTSATAEMAKARWSVREHGYDVSVRLQVPGWDAVRRGQRLGFDLLVNEMRRGRVRRAGQLVWSGGNGWVYLRGDRQDPARFGVLELR
jgi:hypothetical protein